ncbi:MAG: hypothetical protein QOC69_3390, partial [Mycobacterium sp.]|nr:hypothetical protein [Mycobacterium sp.]
MSDTQEIRDANKRVLRRAMDAIGA